MILDGVSYSAFTHLCRVILSHMMNPTVVSLQYDLLRSLGVYRRQLRFPQCSAVNTIRFTSSSSTLLALPSCKGLSTH